MRKKNQVYSIFSDKSEFKLLFEEALQVIYPISSLAQEQE